MHPTPVPMTSAAVTPGGRRLAGLVCLGAALLAGCGGGGHEEPAPPRPPAATDGDVPLTALASTRAYALFVGALAPNDRQAPLRLGLLPPPVSDTDAPITLP
jgi:hypothetical protein